MKYVEASYNQTLRYLDTIQGLSDVLALRHIAKLFISGKPVKATVTYMPCDGNLTSCAENVMFYDSDGAQLGMKDKFAQYDDDVAEAIEDELGDTFCSMMSGYEKYEQEFDLAERPQSGLVLYVRMQ